MILKQSTWSTLVSLLSSWRPMAVTLQSFSTPSFLATSCLQVWTASASTPTVGETTCNLSSTSWFSCSKGVCLGRTLERSSRTRTSHLMTISRKDLKWNTRWSLLTCAQVHLNLFSEKSCCLALGMPHHMKRLYRFWKKRSSRRFN